VVKLVVGQILVDEKRLLLAFAAVGSAESVLVGIAPVPSPP